LEDEEVNMVNVCMHVDGCNKRKVDKNQNEKKQDREGYHFDIRHFAQHDDVFHVAKHIGHIEI
jgi:hypothetical protein